MAPTASRDVSIHSHTFLFLQNESAQEKKRICRYRAGRGALAWPGLSTLIASFSNWVPLQIRISTAAGSGTDGYP